MKEWKRRQHKIKIKKERNESIYKNESQYLRERKYLAPKKTKKNIKNYEETICPHLKKILKTPQVSFQKCQWVWQRRYSTCTYQLVIMFPWANETLGGHRFAKHAKDTIPFIAKQTASHVCIPNVWRFADAMLYFFKLVTFFFWNSYSSVSPVGIKLKCGKIWIIFSRWRMQCLINNLENHFLLCPSTD